MAQQRVGAYWHVFPTYKQGKNIAWLGHTKDGRRFIDHFHPDLVTQKHNTDLRVEFANGSHYQVVGTDNLDSLVGTNPVGVIMSEYSLHDPAAWDYLRPILAENGGWALFLYTPRGKNHGYRLFEMARKNPAWFVSRLSAGSNGTKNDKGEPVISDEAIDEERRAGMPEEVLQQEFFTSFEASMVGAYYSKQLDRATGEKRIGDFRFDPALPVDTYWDIGMADQTAIWFVQELFGSYKFIDYVEASGEPLTYYARILKEDHRSEYNYRQMWAPHDMKVREWTSGVSRLETARKLGIKFQVVPNHQVMDGIDACRNVLAMCYFDESRCERGINALRSYRKEFDSKRGLFRESPEHDWTSHAADAFRMFAMAKRRSGGMRQTRPQQATDTYDYMRGPTTEALEGVS